MQETSLFRRNLGAIGLCVMASTAFTFSDTLCKYLAQSYSIYQVIFLVNVFTLLTAMAWLIKSHGIGGLRTPHLKWHLLRGASVCATAFFVVNAFSRIPLADFYGIVFMSPLVIMIMSHLVLRESVGLHRVLATIVGFGGVLILAGPQFDHYNAGLLFAFGSVIFITTNALLSRKLKAESVMPLFAIFPAAVNVAVNLPGTIMTFATPTWVDLGLFVICAPILITGLVGLSSGIAKATETAVVMPFGYVQILWGALLGYLLFGDVPTVTTVVGCAIIIASGVYALWREHLDHQRRQQKLQQPAAST